MPLTKTIFDLVILLGEAVTLCQHNPTSVYVYGVAYSKLLVFIKLNICLSTV